MKNWLDISSKESIALGIFSALIIAIGSILTIVLHALPGILFLYKEAVVSFVIAPILILALAKVPKRGVLTLLGGIMGGFWIFFGFFSIAIGGLIGGILADSLASLKSYKSPLLNSLGYALIRLGYVLGNYLPLMIWTEQFIQSVERNHPSSAVQFQWLLEILTPQSLGILLVFNLLFSLLGAYFGHYLLRRHFKRAGIV
ncbi:MAG: MptD family putative ECF transporter S component [Wolinella succinogenes]|uniref:MptD family putative ECF transporter S component n=1 Tax=Wolinella succinogenes TaxID=844 RepID=UPI0016BC0BBA|nr:MptD family putative ECF transporter S component [Wolinella succinogenes]NLU34499.1 MptD family putative ECF transporter S component [Wolinella succinogenes]